MKYDFDKPVKRFGTDSMKWDIDEKEIPMWVADMDFQTAPEIREAFAERIDHGVFGYSLVPDAWYEAYRSWWKNRHAFDIDREWLIFTTGVVPAISSAVRKLTTVGENVLIQSPVYNIFYNSIVNNGRNVQECPLTYDGLNYSLDFAELEKKLKDPQTSLMILCNPHNPVGKIWDRETLNRVGELCHDNNVVVLSDEIHCDLTDPGKEYVPFASVSEKCRMNSVTCLAPTKAFNLAGLQTAAVMVPNDRLRHKMYRALNTDEIAEPNSFATLAAITAFTRGADWLDELREYLLENKKLVRSHIKSQLPRIKVVPSEATYLLWLDCRDITGDSEALYAHIRKETGLYLTDGAHYGSGGEGFLRMNVACPRSLVEKALVLLDEGINSYIRLQGKA